MHCHDRKYGLILTRNTNTVIFGYIKHFIEIKYTFTTHLESIILTNGVIL